jgi:hypothetical protein
MTGWICINQSNLSRRLADRLFKVAQRLFHHRRWKWIVQIHVGYAIQPVVEVARISAVEFDIRDPSL